MPYAIIEEGGKQYKVQQGDSILIELREAEPGSEIRFDRVLLYHDGTKVRVGKPLVDDVSVSGLVKAQSKGPKLIAYKYRRRAASSHDKKGHRQKYLQVEITKISAGS